MEQEHTIVELLTGILGWEMLAAIMFFGLLGAVYRKVAQFEGREGDEPFTWGYWLRHNWRGMVTGAIIQYVYGVFAPWLVVWFENMIPEGMPFQYALTFAGLLTGYYSSQLGDRIAKANVVLGKVGGKQ